jgi:hypothetical protein
MTLRNGDRETEFNQRTAGSEQLAVFSFVFLVLPAAGWLLPVYQSASPFACMG